MCESLNQILVLVLFDMSTQSQNLHRHHVSRRLDEVGVISDQLCLTILTLSAGLDFRESVDSKVIKQSISSFSSIVKEQLEEKVILYTFTWFFTLAQS